MRISNQPALILWMQYFQRILNVPFQIWSPMTLPRVSWSWIFKLLRLCLLDRQTLIFFCAKGHIFIIVFANTVTTRSFLLHTKIGWIGKLRLFCESMLKYAGRRSEQRLSEIQHMYHVQQPFDFSETSYWINMSIQMKGFAKQIIGPALSPKLRLPLCFTEIPLLDNSTLSPAQPK